MTDTNRSEEERLAAELRAVLNRVQSLMVKLHALGWNVHIKVEDVVKVEIGKIVEL